MIFAIILSIAFIILESVNTICAFSEKGHYFRYVVHQMTHKGSPSLTDTFNFQTGKKSAVLEAVKFVKLPPQSGF